MTHEPALSIEARVAALEKAKSRLETGIGLLIIVVLLLGARLTARIDGRADDFNPRFGRVTADEFRLGDGEGKFCKDANGTVQIELRSANGNTAWMAANDEVTVIATQAGKSQAQFLCMAESSCLNLHHDERYASMIVHEEGVDTNSSESAAR